MKSPIIFRVFKNNQIHFVKQFTDRDQIVFGSSQESGSEVDVDLTSSEVSAIHCLVEKRGPQYYLCDLGSTQGTFKNGQMILDEPLNPSDEFQIGPFKVIFFVGVPKPNVVTGLASAALPASLPVSLPASHVQPPVIQQDTQPQSIVSEPVIIPEPVQVIKENESTQNVKPKITSTFVNNLKTTTSKQVPAPYKKKVKNQKTFGVESVYKNLSDFIKTGKGQLVEVIVSWGERVLTTYHFEPRGQIKAGPNSDIQIPSGTLTDNYTLLDFSQSVVIQLDSSMVAEVNRTEDFLTITESRYQLQQNEVVFIKLKNNIQLAIRFAGKTKPILLDSPLILNSSEFTGILAAAIFAVFLSLIVTVLTPKKIVEEEEIQRVAQVIFNKPPVIPPPAPTPPPVEPKVVTPPEPPKPKPTEPLKIAQVEKEKEQKIKGNTKQPEAVKTKAQSSGLAQDLKPKDPNLKNKTFTSTKQGGAIKTGNVAGANAKSKDPDPKNTGLLSAFGTGGARSTLDKAYDGAGEALGAGSKATGTSGFNEDRAGNDLGSKFKDTGAGGKGTATQGISGLGTKGLGSGYGQGNGTGFGSKDTVQIQAGGAGEEFVGSIDKDAVRRAVNSAKSALKACYDREYKSDTSLEGKLVFSWEIHARGIAKNVRLVNDKTTLNNSAVANCVKARLATIQFPEPPTNTIAEIVYPFLFQGEK